MKGKNKGVQARLLEKNTRALFVSCGAHTLNLVVCDAAKGSVDTMSYFGVLQKLYTLFSASSQIWAILKNHVSVTLKMWAETRWESKVKSVEPMRYQGTVSERGFNWGERQHQTPDIKRWGPVFGSYRFSICTFVKKWMWRLYWNKKGWGTQSVTSHMNHMMSISVMHLGSWRLDSSMLLLMQPRQPSRRGFPHWKMWETNSGFWQISQVLHMRSWQSSAMH